MLDHIEIKELYLNEISVITSNYTKFILRYLCNDTVILAQYPDIAIEIFQKSLIIVNSRRSNRLEIWLNTYFISVALNNRFPHIETLKKSGDFYTLVCAFSMNQKLP